MNICQTKVLKVIKRNTMKRPIIIVGHTYNFTDKIKCYFNTNNTYYTYNQTLSKLSLMSPTSYQTAPPRVIKFSIYVILAAAFQAYLSQNDTQALCSAGYPALLNFHIDKPLSTNTLLNAECKKSTLK